MYNRTEIASLLKNQPVGEKVTVMGWVRAFRNINLLHFMMEVILVPYK